MVRVTDRPQLSRRFAEVHSSPARDLLTLTSAHAEIISFAGGLPAKEAFDIEGLRSAVESLQLTPALLNYSTTEGMGDLRELVASRLSAEGVPTTADGIVVTTGSQQALMMLAAVLVEPGAVVVVVRPSYLGMTQALTIAGARLVSVESGAQGPDLEQLERVVVDHRPVLLYLNPTFQNPTGYTIPAPARAAIVEMAHRHGFRIVEDDPYRELRYEAAPVPSFTSFDSGDAAEQVVIGTGSFSKVLAPGLRVGWMRPPADLRPAVNVAKQAFDLHSATITQQIVVRYLLGGRFEGALERTRALYRERRDAMVDLLDAALPSGSEWTIPTGGMFVWIRLPEGFDSIRLLEAATAEGVVFSPGVPFYTDAPDTRRIRLSYTTNAPDGIREGLQRLAKAVDAAG